MSEVFQAIVLTIFGLFFIYIGLTFFYILMKPTDKKAITTYPKVLVRVYDSSDRDRGNMEIYAYKVDGQYFIKPNSKDVEELTEVTP